MSSKGKHAAMNSLRRPRSHSRCVKANFCRSNSAVFAVKKQASVASMAPQKEALPPPNSAALEGSERKLATVCPEFSPLMSWNHEE
jgi:hypothetical protein